MAQETMVRGTTFTEPNDREIVATRWFDAPRQLVWDVHTMCEHLPNWQTGPEGGGMPTCEMDLRPGGKWRNVYTSPGTPPFEMSGEYREIVEPQRLVNTEIFEGSEALDTLTLTEEGGRTKLMVSVVYASNEEREAAKATGMEDGWAESYERLDRYLRTLV